MADSISIYGEGSFAEQIQDLVNYLVRSQGQGIIPQFQEALQKDEPGNVLNLVLQNISDFGDGSDKEIEGFFNLLFAHLLSENGPSGSIPTVLSILESASRPFLKLQIITNLFNALPKTSPLRIQVYSSLLRLALEQGNIDVLHLSKSQVEKWLDEWPISSEEKAKFLKSIIDAFTATNQPLIAYEYLFYYTRQLSPSDPDCTSAAINLIASSLRIPTFFQFDSLLTVNAVVAAKEHALFSLLHIFLNDSIAELQTWSSKHSDLLQQYDLSPPDLERKIRLLALAALGSKHVGKQVSYSSIASTINVPSAEVEKWVIDVIRCGLLSGKLAQTSETLFVTRSTARVFEKEQWQLLENRLVSWKQNLKGVVNVIAAARKQAGDDVSIPQTTQNPLAASVAA